MGMGDLNDGEARRIWDRFATSDEQERQRRVEILLQDYEEEARAHHEVDKIIDTSGVIDFLKKLPGLKEATLLRSYWISAETKGKINSFISKQPLLLEEKWRFRMGQNEPHITAHLCLVKLPMHFKGWFTSVDVWAHWGLFGGADLVIGHGPLPEAHRGVKTVFKRKIVWEGVFPRKRFIEDEWRNHRLVKAAVDLAGQFPEELYTQYGIEKYETAEAQRQAALHDLKLKEEFERQRRAELNWFRAHVPPFHPEKR